MYIGLKPDVLDTPITAVNNATANELLTVGSSTSELDAEGNLTFDGSTFAVTGAATISTTLGVTGNTGIGTNSPTVDTTLSGLSINSSSTVLQVHGASGAELKLTDPDAGANRGLGITLQGAHAMISNAESTGDIKFGTNNTFRMKLNYKGYLSLSPTDLAVSAVGGQGLANHPCMQFGTVGILQETSAVTNNTNLPIGGQRGMRIGWNAYHQNASGDKYLTSDKACMMDCAEDGNIYFRVMNTAGTAGQVVSWKQGLMVSEGIYGQTVLCGPNVNNIQQAYPYRRAGVLNVHSSYAGTGSTIATFRNTSSSGGSELQFYTEASYASAIQAIDYPVAGATRALHLQKEGNKVGIGNVTPSHILHINGQGRATNSAWATSSDKRVKENIVDHEAALAKINQLRPVSFNFISEYREHNPTETGFLAQEFREVFPSAVTITPETYGEKKEWDADTKKEIDKLYAQRITLNKEIEDLTEKQDYESTTQMKTLKESLVDVDAKVNTLAAQKKVVKEGTTISDFQVLQTDCLLPALVKAVQELSAKVDSLENQIGE